jgi:multisubunit Na+/H+ antiporter MnhG subunit
MLVIVFALLAVIMMGISMALPWYVVSTELAGEKAETTYSFSGISMDIGNGTESRGWGEEPLDELYDNQAGVYTIAMIMTILGLVFAILLLIGAIMAKKGKGKKLAVIFGLLAFIFCLLAPILFMAMHPGAVAQDYKDNSGAEPEGKGPHDSFMGEEKQEFFNMEIKYSWGGGAGWFMAVIGFIFALLGFILALKLPKPAYSSPASMPPPGPGPAAPPPQQYPNYGQPPQYPQQQQPPPPQYPQY